MSAPAAGLEIVEVDPSDPSAFRAFYDPHAAALRHGPQGEFSTPWQPEEMRLSMAEPDERSFRIGWAGRLDGRVVVTGWTRGSTVDNTDLGVVQVCCSPPERGRGHGAAMLDHVERYARSRGISRLVGEVAWPWDAGAEGTGSEDLAWARRQGFELALVDVQRRLALPVPPLRLDELAAEAAAHHEGYTVRSFTGAVPEDLVDGWAALSASLMTEAPMGDIEREPETGEAAVVRADEALLAKQGRQRTGTVAVSADGTVVAYSDLVATIHEAERAYQWGTVVRPDHRGHRLGLAVKVENLRRLQESRPEITTVVTFNAEVNAPMVAVNDRLGFVPVQWLGEVVKKLDGGAPRLRL